LGWDKTFNEKKSPTMIDIIKILKERKKIIVLLILLLGVVVRAYYLLAPFVDSLVITPDESVYGLQALHFLKGDPTVFYWAQPYTGTPSAIISSILFWIFSPSVILLKIVPFICSIAFIFTNYLLAKSVFKSEKMALLTLFISAIGSPFWNNWSSRAGSGYPEASLLGNIILLLAIQKFWNDDNKGLLKTFLIGLFCGFGFWIQPTIVYYAIPVLVFLLLWFFRNRVGIMGGLRDLGVFSTGAIIGMAPVIYHNLVNPAATTTAALIKTPWGEKDAFLGLVTKSFPILLGTRTSWSEIDFFLPLAITVWSIFAFSLGWFSIGIVRGIRRDWRNLGAECLLAAVFLTTVAVFCLSGSFGQLVLEPRYVLALYSFIPLVIAFFVSKWRVLTYLAILIFFLNFLVGIFSAPPFSFTNPYKLDKIISYLESNNLLFVRSDAELAHRLMFLSNEKIIASVSEGGMMAQRRREYEDLVKSATKQETAYVFRNSSKILPGLFKQIQNEGYQKVFEDSEISVFVFGK